MRSDLVVFGYTNYREYLRDFYLYKKQGKRGYSYRQFSQAAGFSAPNVLKLVIEGSRNIGQGSLEKFLLGLGLQGKEAAYFCKLVMWNQADNDLDRSQLFEDLKKLTPQARRYELEADAVEYLSHWIYPVLREMAQWQQFRDDPYWIQRRLQGRIELKDIISALQFLKKKGFITKNELGMFEVKSDLVITSDEVKSLAVRSFHRKILEQSLEVLEDLPLDKREFGALIFQLPEEKIPELKEKLKAFRRDLHAWALEKADEPSDKAVIQLNLQLFPQTKGAGS